MDLNYLGQLMVKHGAVIRAIPESVRHVLEKSHAAEFPSGEVKFLPEYKREMLVLYTHPIHAGQFTVELAKHTTAGIQFTGSRFFNTLEEVAKYLDALGKESKP